MADAPPAGVVFPDTADGPSTSALGRAVVADALRSVDPAGAAAAEAETDWRRGYRRHFRRLAEAGLASPESALAIAREGSMAVQARMRYATGERRTTVAEALAAPWSGEPLGTATVMGGGAAEPEFTLPYRGERLRGTDLRRQLDAWYAPAWWSRRAPRRSGSWPTTRSGSGCPTGGWSCSAPAPRWDR